MRETRDLEFKETISKSFLKTAVAFANFQGGRILFGITDEGEVKGMENIKEACLAIENMINDSISPKMDYEIHVDETVKTIELYIPHGDQAPYFYHSKTYKRNDASTVELDGNELKK